MSNTQKNDLSALQNGSDIRGIAMQTVNKEVTLPNQVIEKIGYGFAVWLKEKKHLAVDSLDKPVKVAVGHDSRLSGERIKTALIEALTNAGIDVVDVGLATTPALFMATQYEQYDCEASIMITASHLPFEYNGLKFFTASGGAEHEDIAYILEHADWDAVTWENNQGVTMKKTYWKNIRQICEKKLSQVSKQHLIRICR